MTNKRITVYALTTAIIAEIFLIFIIYFNPNKIEPVMDSQLQSLLSGSLNALSAIALFIAYLFVKKKNTKWHKIFIHIALVFSSLFLVNYILYHMSVGHIKYLNEDFRTLYLFILITHLLTSVISLPMIFITYALGITGRLQEHLKIAKMTFLLWEYVSVTGVIVVYMLNFLK